jgi:Zn-dependent metalloprotease
MKTFCLRLVAIIIISCLSINISYSQIYSGQEAAAIIKESTLIKYNSQRNSIDYIRIDPAYDINESLVFKWLSENVARSDNNNSLQLERRDVDKNKFSHIKYKQYYKGIPVEYGIYKAHIRNGKLESVNGEYYSHINLNTIPTLSKKSAFSKALEKINAITYKDDNSVGLSATQDKGELVVFPKDSKTYLAYKFDIYALEPLKRVYIYVDAHSGEILFEENRIHHSDSQGSAVTGFSGTQTITTDSISPSSFRLIESGRGNGIRTKNLNNGSNYSTATDFTDSDNVWNSTSLDKYAYDAHYGAEKTYDFFFDNYGLNSYDGSGATISSYVHYGNNYVNAFWDGTQMTYGDGDGTQYRPLTSMEIVGHEITHAVTEHSAGLVYSGESGALNESFSDVFGATIRFINTPTLATWFLGDQILISGGTGTPFRNMADPNEFSCADTYQGLYWNNGDIVHYDSGVQNFWYYLLSSGGSGTNDIGNTYTVNAIGFADAAAIAYRNLSVYLTPNATFADARFYAIQSAEDLFGSCSNQVIQTTNAWYAVGVGGIFSNAVVAGFSTAQNYFCVLPSTVNFSNTSLNGTSYSWDFGDGSASSSQQNPAHVYSTAGLFTITLIVNGTGSCSSGDTLVRTDHITVVNGGGPVSASCSPATNSFCCGVGIQNVQFGSINKSSSNASEGYQDFTCGNATTVVAGDPVTLRVTTGNTSNETVKAWIDYNNNGSFDTLTEQVLTSINQRLSHNKIVHTPLNAVLNTPVRMRVMDDYFSYSSFGPCSNSQNGQAEDYTITFLANTLAPIADFVGNETVVNVGGSINFDDLTIHAPTSWQWTFVGGVPATSTSQNPTVRYDSLGTYEVRLTAMNSFGTDSITKVSYISVINSINLCSSTTNTTASEGILYDSGGPSGSYNISQNCTLLIQPNCAIDVSLSFTQFATESCCDFITIYDGISTSSPLLLNSSGASIPASVTANSGKMLIVWRSDGSVNLAGFAAQWTSTLANPLPPVASFSHQYTNPPLATPIQFTDQSTNTPISWEWNFGDGNTSNLRNPIHSYSASGTYTIQLIAHNCVSSDTLIENINIQSSPVISTNPVSISTSLGCNDTIVIPMTIYNTGSGDLVFNINGTDSNSPVSILAMTYGVDMSTEYPNTINAISSGFSNYTVTTTGTIIDTVLHSALIDKDVLLFPEQETGNSAHYPAIAPIVQNFMNAGGVVIVCGVYGSSNLTQNMIYELGLFTGAYVTYSSTGTAYVSDTTDDLMDGVPLTFSLSNQSFMHNITNTDKVELVSSNSNDLVTYRNYGQGKAIYIGFDYFAVNAENQRIISNAVRYANSSKLPNWLSVDTTSGILVPGDSTIIYLTFISNGLAGGTYTSNLYLYSNDSINPIDSIPISMTISNGLCANFTFSSPSICSGQVAFTDVTLNSPTTWTWKFGDGNTSSQQNPIHYYNTTGTYDVKLIACNGVNCDSLEKTVSITGVVGPVTASCEPMTTGNCCGMGIYNVTFNTINNTTSDGIDGYSDYTCTSNTTVTSGSSYNLSVRTGTSYSENVRAWIDFNNNGILEDVSETVMVSNNIYTNHSATVVIPNTSVTNRPLRMRVSSDYYTSTLMGPCDDQTYGQAEDYTIFIEPNTSPPQANFTVNVINTCAGQVSFTDNSGNTPTSWQWDFGDGATSTIQNPTHQYTLPGTYTVSLLATNPFGSNTTTRQTTVNVLASSMSIGNNRYVGESILYSSNATGATGYLWDFGDGYLSSLANPSHTYTAIGTYYVSLTVSNSQCTTTILDTILIGINDVKEIDGLFSFDLTPNPFSNELSIQYQLNSQKSITLQAYDLLGKSIINLVIDQIQSPGNYTYTFSPPAAGVYFIKFSGDKESIVRRVVKVN